MAGLELKWRLCQYYTLCRIVIIRDFVVIVSIVSIVLYNIILALRKNHRKKRFISLIIDEKDHINLAWNI